MASLPVKPQGVIHSRHRSFFAEQGEGDLQATRIRGCFRVSAEEIRRFEETLKEMFWR
jgi:hypothetical protein